MAKVSAVRLMRSYVPGYSKVFSVGQVGILPRSNAECCRPSEDGQAVDDGIAGWDLGTVTSQS